MSVLFTDSSAVIKRYVREAGSQWVKNIFTDLPANQVFVAAITSVEVASAITRRGRGDIRSQKIAAPACALFLADYATDYEIVEISDFLLDQAVQLAQFHGLRGYDAVQLAAGREVNRQALLAGLPPITFISADQELNAAASAEGLTVDDPNQHP
ncbi:MAG: type II toxin-antitoxin system VapC family toxin [Janthinobacterium lividum]